VVVVYGDLIGGGGGGDGKFTCKTSATDARIFFSLITANNFSI